jgi:hypothetical protein
MAQCQSNLNDDDAEGGLLLLANWVPSPQPSVITKFMPTCHAMPAAERKKKKIVGSKSPLQNMNPRKSH